MGIALTACSSDGTPSTASRSSPGAPTRSISPGDPTPSEKPSSTDDQVKGPDASASGGDDKTPEGKPDPENDDEDTMTFSEFWPERNQYVGKETRLRAKVVYELECPPDDQSNCTATGYLTSRDKDVFLAHEEKEALLIHDGGEPVRCQTPTTLGLDCRGWQQHEEYVVRGVVHRDGSDYRIDVKEREHV